MLLGQKIYLRAIETEDLERLRKWRNRPEFKRNFREYRELSRTMQNNWFNNIVNGDKSTIMFAICRNATEELLGCCGLCYINWVQRNADLSLYIGYENSYIDNEGFAEEACRLLFSYGFDELNLHKIWTELYEYDKVKKDFYMEKFGFKVDGLLRDNHYMDGKWWGSWMLSLLKDEFDGGRRNGCRL